MILSQLSETVLEREAENTHFPKWNTLCLLRSLHLPTLDGALLLPGTSKSHVEALVDKFSSLLGVTRLLVRSDGGREITDYYKGGNTLLLSQVVELTLSLLQSNRAVILLEPTNRFQNRLSVNFLASRRAGLVVEILGPGYDASDLNRAGVPPKYVIQGDAVNWLDYVTLSIADVKGTSNYFNETERRRLRLRNLGISILPNSGVDVKGNPELFAEEWLRSMGYDDLWQPWNFSLDLSQLQTWYDDAFLVSQFLTRHRHWEAFVLSWSRLADYRCVYWDIVEDGTKFAISSKPLLPQ